MKPPPTKVKKPFAVETFNHHPLRFVWDRAGCKLAIVEGIDEGLRRVALVNAGGKLPRDGNVTEKMLAKALKELEELRLEVRRLNRRRSKR